MKKEKKTMLLSFKLAGRVELEPQGYIPHKENLSSFILAYRRDLSYLKSDKSDTESILIVTPMCHLFTKKTF